MSIDEDLKKILEKMANAIRQLSMEAVQKANSGHPGLPMGCAELGAYLYGHLLRHNPRDPNWVNRDRVVLSAGHGSMWLYSCLHLAGFDLSLDEIKRFRQLHSKTPGHPEYHETPGVEATTGPLGQGVGNGVGQALGLKILGEKYNRGEDKILDAKVYCLAGDGCMMEGVSNEASCLAGHLRLDNLIVIHDDNKITLDGPLKDSSSEDVAERYRGYGFDTYVMEGNDLNSIHEVMTKVVQNQTKPVFISCHTVIGKGSPHKAGTHEAHGSPLGEEEVKETKEALGLPEEEFYVPQQVRTFFENKLPKQQELQEAWNQKFSRWEKRDQDLARDFQLSLRREIPSNLEEELKGVEFPESISGRKGSQAILQKLGDLLPFLYGGSADLSGSDCTMMKQFPVIKPGEFNGRNIKYGIREFGMATIAAGLFQTGMILPYIGTFFTFSDYMRNAIRLASLSGYHVIYQLTHDSIFLGEDGPTHQPIEHLAALRAMPNLQVFRPADAHEVRGAWIAMLEYSGPSVIVLSRQNLPTLKETDLPYKEGVGRGGYILKKEKSRPDFTIFATGSEVSLGLDVARELEKQGKDVRVVSMPCVEIFQKQDESYRNSIVGGDIGKRISIEAGVSQGWFRYIGHEGIPICMESFGLSAPIGDLANEFGFTVDAILDRILTSK
jgi:transketolase